MPSVGDELTLSDITALSFRVNRVLARGDYALEVERGGLASRRTIAAGTIDVSIVLSIPPGLMVASWSLVQVLNHAMAPGCLSVVRLNPGQLVRPADATSFVGVCSQ